MPARSMPDVLRHAEHGLRVVRIPAALATPLPRHAIPYVREYIAQQQLRLVVHAPFAHIHQLIPDCGNWEHFLSNSHVMMR
jgi:hypothetical protein